MIDRWCVMQVVDVVSTQSWVWTTMWAVEDGQNSSADEIALVTSDTQSTDNWPTATRLSVCLSVFYSHHNLSPVIMAYTDHLFTSVNNKAKGRARSYDASTTAHVYGLTRPAYESMLARELPLHVTCWGIKINYKVIKFYKNICSAKWAHIWQWPWSLNDP